MLNTKLGQASLHHEKFLIPINLLFDSSVLAMSHSLYLDTSRKYFLIFTYTTFLLHTISLTRASEILDLFLTRLQ